MDRLTERFSNGQAAVYGCGGNCKYDFKYCNKQLEDCPTINEIYERLAQYEEIGLTQEQLLQVDEMYTDRCREITGLQRKAKKETNHEKLSKITGCEESVEIESLKMLLEKICDDIEHGLFEINYDKYVLLYKSQIEWLNSKAI